MDALNKTLRELRNTLAERGIELTPQELAELFAEAFNVISHGACRVCGETNELRHGICFDCVMSHQNLSSDD